MTNDIEQTVIMFQTKYRSPNGPDPDEHEAPHLVTVPCIMPAGWRKRIQGNGKVYKYNKTEIMEYNEVQWKYGAKVAKRWADRRWHERTKRDA